MRRRQAVKIGSQSEHVGEQTLLYHLVLISIANNMAKVQCLHHIVELTSCCELPD